MTDFWHDRRVFVTGGTGLVGSWLIKELVQAEANVVALIRDWDPQSELIRCGIVDRISVVSGSLDDYACLERAINAHECETVFHLGAQALVGVALRSPLETFEANIRGTYNLLEACRVHSSIVKAVIIASSDKAYGDSEVLPYTENMPPLGRHPYDVSKSCADLLAQTYHNTYGTPVVVARCGNIYGGGDLNWSRIIPGTIKCLYNDQQPVIRSDGKFTRDYVYVKDAVKAYMAMAEAAGRPEVVGQAFNFGPEKPTSVVELVDILRELMDKSDLEPLILNEARGEIRDQYLDSGKARRILGWEPLYGLTEGLTETVAWYENLLGYKNECQ